MTDEQIRALEQAVIQAAREIRRLEKIIAERDAALQRFAEFTAPCPVCVSKHGRPDPNCSTCRGTGRSPVSRSGVITTAPRLTDEEDSKALWLTRRLMPQEPER